MVFSLSTSQLSATLATRAYDGQGHLSSKTDQNGNTVQYVYDPTGQLTSVVQLSHPNPSNNTNQYGYDNDGNLNFLSDENGHASTGGYDLLADLTSYGLPDGSLTEATTYDLAGNILSWQHFNGKTTSYTYDSQYRLLTKTPDPSLKLRVQTQLASRSWFCSGNERTPHVATWRENRPLRQSKR